MVIAEYDTFQQWIMLIRIFFNNGSDVRGHKVQVQQRMFALNYLQYLANTVFAYLAPTLQKT